LRSVASQSYRRFSLFSLILSLETAFHGEVKREKRRMKSEEYKKKRQFTLGELSFLFGAGGGGRTRTVSLPLDFESVANRGTIRHFKASRGNYQPKKTAYFNTFSVKKSRKVQYD
jgi:hypothetical protein